MKTALVTGVTGQDGSYLSELLLKNNYRVVGMSRRNSTDNTERIRHLFGDSDFKLVYGDVTDSLCMLRLLDQHEPDEVYNLAAQSHVFESFCQPEYTTEATYMGALNILEAIRQSKANPKFYQASSSEMFGSSYSVRKVPVLSEQQQNELTRFVDSRRHAMVGVTVFGHGHDEERYQDENTPMLPNSPYAVAKLAAHHLCRIYREAYGIYACSGILHNHESERRGVNFVTRKITRYIGELKKNDLKGKLKLGNLEARRDWGHAEDYVRGMWLMLQQGKPDDYMLATGESHSVREFLVDAFKCVDIDIERDFDLYVEIDPTLCRPCEVPHLHGDFTKARTVLNWRPAIGFQELVRRMVYADCGA